MSGGWSPEPELELECLDSVGYGFRVSQVKHQFLSVFYKRNEGPVADHVTRNELKEHLLYQVCDRPDFKSSSFHLQQGEMFHFYSISEYDIVYFFILISYLGFQGNISVLVLCTVSSQLSQE